MKSRSSTFNFKLLPGVLLAVTAVALHLKITDRLYRIAPVHRARQLLAENFDVLYLSDSTNFTFGEKDRSNCRISDFLAGYLPGLNVQTIEHSAYHASVYLEYLKFFVRSGKFPRQAVVPVNLESFAYIRESWEPYKFLKHRFALRYGRIFEALYHPLMVFKFPFAHFDDLSSPPPTTFDETDPFRLRIEQLYLREIEPSRRRLQDLASFAQIARKNGIQPLLFLLPVDFEEGEKHFPHFRRMIEKNAHTITSILAEKGENVLDLSLALPSVDFAWREAKLINNHLAEHGRQFVAKRIAERLSDPASLTR